MPEYRVTATVTTSDRNRTMEWSVIEDSSWRACDYVLDRFGEDYTKIKILKCERVEPGALDRPVRKI